MAQSFWTRRGDEIRLGTCIGGGGEGNVFDVIGRPGVVAKIYTDDGVRRGRAAKLVAMVELVESKPALLGFCAWPVASLHATTQAGSADGLRGLLMPKVSGRHEIHHLTSPPTRKRDFPDKGWAFQIHVAQNLAAAIGTIHEAGVVVGDINEKGFLVGNDGTLQVIDCDSFQFTHRGHLFKCEVGVPDYTPPELQSIPGGFGSVVRTVNHDAFGLAIIVFKLLFQGRHPFMGRFTGTGEPDLQRFIREHRFAYGRNSGAKRIAPPPHSLHLDALTPRVATLFEQAFAENSGHGGRPPANQWYDALTDLSRTLTVCQANDGHQYLKGVASCPWCAIERASGVVFFFGRIAISGGRWTLNVSYFAAAVRKLPELVPDPCPEPRVSVIAKPVPVELERGARVRRRFRLSLIVCGLAVCLGAMALRLGPWLVAGGVLVLWGWLLGSPRDVRAEIARRKDAVETARTAHTAVVTEWNQIPVKSYSDGRRALQEILREYGNLQNAHAQGLAELERKKRDIQLQDYLDDFNLRDERIKGIGPARLATLASFGIDTAADLTPERLRTVAGIGEGLTGILLAWRSSKESRFRFDPTKPVDPRDLANLMQKLQTRRQALETEMNRRIRTLTQQAAEIVAHRKALAGRIQAVARNLAQAQADLNALAPYMR